ncbi:MAG: family 16 glycosylhydrolase [Planctomycetota bacterium]|nr:family 16 glycosylhydrolase [Planctomycetota bacterium]
MKHDAGRVVPSLALALLAIGAPALGQGTPWQLVWSDEFDGTTLNRDIWQPQFGTGTIYGLPSGWGNNERQYYTDRPENIVVSNGSLKIIARAEFYAGSQYTSARIRTPGTLEILYGRIEARITLPSGPGIWPAFWMLPTTSPYGGWAASGEIDIMESVNDADRIYGTIHFGGAFPANTSNGGSFAPGIDFSAAPHIYAVEWEPDQIRWYVDGQLIHSAASSVWFSANENGNDRAPFDVPFHLLLNVAVGGNFPGPPSGSTGFPMTMTVDYVRIFERQQLPFTSSSAAIPGQIEAENYDLGGAGFAYLDSDASNNGGVYRPSESVDLEACSEGGFNLGWIRQREWVEYAADVAVSGVYRVLTRVAAQSGGGTFRLEFGGVNRSGTIAAPVTGGWQQWTTVEKTATLLAGSTTMRFVNESGAGGQFNVNWFRFELIAEAGDVNADTRVNAEDLYALEQGTGQYEDVDLDGESGTADDFAALKQRIRTGEVDPG